MSLLLVGLGASAALAKPSVAILGLEVIDKSGTPTPVDTQVASELTQGLRARAKAGTGPYTIAPGSDKELIDEKLLKNCDDERKECMAAIGNELQSEFLLYGRIEKQGGAYTVTITLLDVKRKVKEKTSNDTIPLADASGAALQGWAKKIYARLTGQSELCVIVVKTPGVDRATILVDGAEKGNITNGVGQVSLPENKYKISVDAPDYRRYEKPDVSCTAGQTQNISADMQKSGPGEVGPGGTGTTGTGGTGTGDLGHTGTVSQGGNKGVWKAMAWGGLAGAAVGGGVWIFGYAKYSLNAKFSDADVNTALMGSQFSGQMGGTFGDNKCGSPEGDYVASKVPNFDKGCTGKKITTIGIGMTIGFGVVGAVGFIMAYARGDDKEKPVSVTGHHKKHEPFAIVPVVGPNGGGASFSMEW